MLAKQTITPVVLAIAVLAATPVHATLVPGLDGVSTSSTFEIGVPDPLPALGWSNVSGAAQAFDVGGLNGALIGTSPYDNYEVQYVTGEPMQPNTTYQLDFDMGFVAALTDGFATYTFQLGTVDGGVFSPLGSGASGSVSYAGNLSEGVVSGSDSYVYTSGSTVSGNPLAVRWAQTGTAGSPFSDYFGFDNVMLDAGSPPEVPASSPWSIAVLALLLCAALAFLLRRRLLAKG